MFVSYSHRDVGYCRELLDRLDSLDCVETWWDGIIPAGDRWEPQILHNLRQADVVLLLLSPAFLKSTFCRDTEVNEALLQARARAADLVPVALTDCHWLEAKGVENLRPYQAIPREQKNGKQKFITDYKPRGRGWFLIEDEIIALAGKPRLPVADNLPVPDIPRLVPFLCNRQERLGALTDPLTRYRSRDPRGPFLVVVPGPDDECHSEFVERIEIELPQRLSMPESPVHKKYLDWSRGRDSSTGEIDFVAPAIECLGPMLSDGITLVTCFADGRTWAPERRKFETFFSLWRNWPRIPRTKALVVSLILDYPRGSGPTHVELAEFFDFAPTCDGIVLEELNSIEKKHITEWATLPEVKAFYPWRDELATLLNRVDVAFGTSPAIPMKPLAEELRRVLIEVNRLHQLRKAS